MSEIPPLAAERMRFRRRWRGYDPAEVDPLCETLADELARLRDVIEGLRTDRDRLERELREAAHRERELQDTLVRAQRVSEEILANAQREAQLVVREAEATADRVVQQAVDQVEELEHGIAELRRRRHELRAKLQSTLAVFGRMLEEAEAEDGEPPARVRPLPRRPGS